MEILAKLGERTKRNLLTADLFALYSPLIDPANRNSTQTIVNEFQPNIFVYVVAARNANNSEIVNKSEMENFSKCHPVPNV